MQSGIKVSAVVRSALSGHVTVFPGHEPGSDLDQLQLISNGNVPSKSIDCDPTPSQVDRVLRSCSCRREYIFSRWCLRWQHSAYVAALGPR